MKERASVSGLGAGLKAAYFAGENPAPGIKGDGSIHYLNLKERER
jgi:hypothetical protein